MKFNTKNVFDLKSKTKNQALKEVADYAKSLGITNSSTTLLKALKDREAQMSTGFEDGIAIPHCQSSAVLEETIIVAKTSGIDWQSMDQKEAKVLICILVPEKSKGKHIQILANISKSLVDESKRLTFKVGNKTEIKNLVTSILKPQEKPENNANEVKDSKYNIVAVTACPTGIAHTHLAAETLRKYCKENNLTVKVETQGTEGAQNILSQEEIDKADVVIIAVDRTIELDRFVKRKVVMTNTRVAIKNTQKLVTDSLQGKNLEDVKALGSDSKAVASNLADITPKEFGKNSFKALMNGVSHMLPFIVVGGILIGIAFLIDTIAGSQAGEDFGNIHPAADWIKSIGGILMGLAVPILAAFISHALVGKSGLLPGFLTGMIATGPLTRKGAANGIGFFGETVQQSGFLGAIAGGFLAAIMVILFARATKKIPKTLNGINQILFVPFLATATTAILFYFINIPFGFVFKALRDGLESLESNQSLVVVMGLIVGIMMASDMGGPINKAAYITATSLLGTNLENGGNGTIMMAIVMAAGMVPPLATTIATQIFRKSYTEQERIEGVSNIFMSLSFITEGAIPFAAKKPVTVIPSMMLGSAICGMMIGGFEITLGAPHGGIFVSPLIDSNSMGKGGGIPLFFVAIITGAIVSGFTMGLLNEKGNSKLVKARFNQVKTKFSKK